MDAGAVAPETEDEQQSELPMQLALTRRGDPDLCQASLQDLRLAALANWSRSHRDLPNSHRARDLIRQSLGTCLEPGVFSCCCASARHALAAFRLVGENPRTTASDVAVSAFEPQKEAPIKSRPMRASLMQRMATVRRDMAHAATERRRTSTPHMKEPARGTSRQYFHLRLARCANQTWSMSQSLAASLASCCLAVALKPVLPAANLHVRASAEHRHISSKAVLSMCHAFCELPCSAGLESDGLRRLFRDELGAYVPSSGVLAAASCL